MLVVLFFVMLPLKSGQFDGAGAFYPDRLAVVDCFPRNQRWATVFVLFCISLDITAAILDSGRGARFALFLPESLCNGGLWDY